MTYKAKVNEILDRHHGILTRELAHLEHHQRDTVCIKGSLVELECIIKQIGEIEETTTEDTEEFKKLRKLRDGIRRAFDARTVFDGYLLFRRAWSVYKELPTGEYWANRDSSGNLKKPNLTRKTKHGQG